MVNQHFILHLLKFQNTQLAKDAAEDNVTPLLPMVGHRSSTLHFEFSNYYFFYGAAGRGRKDQ